MLDDQLRQQTSQPAATEGPARARRDHTVALGITVAVVVVLSVWSLLPLWLPLVLAAWFADLVQPLSRRLERRLHGKARAAAVVTVLFVLVGLLPFVPVVLTLASDAAALVDRVLSSEDAQATLQSLLAGSAESAESQSAGIPDPRSLVTTNPERLFEIMRQSGAKALGFAGKLAGATFAAAIALIVFVVGFYGLLVHGPRLGGWLERNSPLGRAHGHRFLGAFYETGRGLIVGVGMTALAQGVIAGVGYLIAGLPHALVFALLTALAGLIPSLGSGFVWLPIGGILLLNGRVTDAVVVLAFGSLAGIADNFLRPVLSRFGRLRVPTIVLLCAMLGGILAFGAAGLVVGPLFVRLTMEGLELWSRRHEPQLIGPDQTDTPEPPG